MSLKIIYLDDEPDLCELFSDEFSSDGVLISTFFDVQKAIDAAKTTKPDLIFIDYRLPDTNGDKVAQAMPADIPKYLITGDYSVDTHYKFNGFFAKPWAPEAIRALFSEANRHVKAP